MAPLPPNHLRSGSPTAVFLESRPGVESLFTRLLRHGAQQAGWKHRVVNLRTEQGSRVIDSDLAAIVSSGPCDLLCFLMDAPLASPGVWKTREFRDLPKISLWYDEFTRSPETLGHPDVWRHWQHDDNVTVYMWDGYWRERWQEHTGHAARPIHLAADPQQLSPNDVSLFPELAEYAVFTGTIPAQKALQDESAALPVPVRNYLSLCVSELDSAPWPLRPYEVAANVRASLSEKQEVVLAQWLSIPVHQALFNHQIWHWAKRIARLRGLAAVMKSGPVAVVSGHHTARFAGEAELRQALKAPESFQFRNTTDVPPHRWSGVFRSGRFQVQFTDPQSIEGGLPFRVFECAASSVALLSDSRPELAAEFINNEEIVLADNEAQLARRAHDLFTADRDMLVSIGAAALDKFRHKHTAAIRWNEILARREAGVPGTAVV